MRRQEEFSEEQKEYLNWPCVSDQVLVDARRLTQDFAKTVRDFAEEKLGGWLQQAKACDAPALRNSATGLRKCPVAVRAGLSGGGPTGWWKGSSASPSC